MNFGEFIEKYITNTSPIYSAIYLYALNREERGMPSLEETAAVFRLMKSDVADAWRYWEKEGLAVLDGEEVLLKSESSACTIVADEGLAILYQEAQRAFVTPMSTTETKKLYAIHTELCLPVPVILMMINYAQTNNKVSIKYLEKMALDWRKKGIDTVEKAEQHFISMEKPKKKPGKFKNFEERNTGYNELEDEYFKQLEG